MVEIDPKHRLNHTKNMRPKVQAPNFKCAWQGGRLEVAGWVGENLGTQGRGKWTLGVGMVLEHYLPKTQLPILL